MKKGFYIAIFLIVIVSIEAFSQSFYSIKHDRKYIASLGTGTSSYYGELSNDDDYMDTKLNLNIGLQYFVSDRIGIRGEITWFQLSGNDNEADSDGRRVRNLSFISNNYELNAQGIINLLPKGQRYYQRRPVNVYGFLGVGLIYFNPKAEVPAGFDESGKKVALQPLKTEGVDYNRFAFVIPYGIGLRIKAGPFFNVAIEGGTRKTFTDYLDDVSTTFQDPATLDSDLARAMADRTQEIQGGVTPRQEGDIRGNPDAKDNYFIANVLVEYYLPSDGLFSGRNRNSRPPRYNVKKRRRR